MSPRSVGRELRADGREGVLQRVDVAGRVHCARVPRGLDGAAVDGTAAVDIPAAVLPGEPEARRGRRGRARQRHRAETFERTGASVMGKRMFDLGEQAWPEEAPFHTPVFVVTHENRDPWERPGGTTFHFVNDGFEPALDQAREAAGDRDVRIAGGGATS